jgi:methylglutaconyl-CoA hydratase
MSFRHLEIRRDGSVERVTLNRPETRNAFDEAMIAELSAWAAGARQDASLRGAVLAGAGSAFCAGADLAWMARMADYSEEENLGDARAMADMFAALDELPVPLVGRVHGAALGGGTGLVAVCDIVVASDDAVFGFTEVRLGLIPAVISPFATAKIGASAARELMLTGRRFSAAEALRVGLVHAVVPRDGLDGAVEEYLAHLRAAGPMAVVAAKRLVREVAGRRPAEVRDETARAIAARRVSREGQEGLRAFLGKRAPSWTR